MKIRSDRQVSINKIWIMPGVHNYRDIDHKDPKTADQLRVYRSLGILSFNEVLDGDVQSVARNDGEDDGQDRTRLNGDEKENKNPGEIVDSSISDGDISNEATDESSGRCEVSERRDGNNTSRKVRRKSRAVKPSLEIRDRESD